MEFTCALSVTRQAVVSYTALPPLPRPCGASTLRSVAVYFCCTGLRVASTGRYPASCPMKPGLSSPAVFRHLQPRLFSQLVFIILTFFRQKVNHLIWFVYIYFSLLHISAMSAISLFYTLKQLPPTNSLIMEFLGSSSLPTARK